MTNYIPTIGIEVHVELKTNTKIFSPSVNGYGMGANMLTNVIDLGYPGTLPTVNKEVVNQAIKTAILLNCKIRKEMHFDRKNYFYPDNSKNYQITQNRTPIGYDGYVEIELGEEKKKIEIEEIHMEEDTCKSAHRKDVTLLDFNRAGVPLIEIVTKPCISSSLEAKLYIEKLREILLYGDISDCKIEEGSMRCDANLSLRKCESDPFGTKVEIKNIGSINNVKLSLEKEMIRQEKLLDQNETFPAQTRRYDDKLGDTVLMRIKEVGNDYRYFPEPDIPFLYLSDEYIENVKKSIPMTADERREEYQRRGISRLNADKLIMNRSLSDYLNKFLSTDIDFPIASNLLLGDISFYLNKHFIKLDDTKLTDEKFIDLVQKIKSQILTSRNVKDILTDVLETDKQIDELIKENNITNIVDNTYLESVIEKVILNNTSSVEDYLSGHDRAFKYLMGQVMKESKGSANPKMASDLLESKLKKLDN